MKPISVKTLCTIISGQHTHGPAVQIGHGAYRLRQVKHPNTVLFIEKRIMNWTNLVSFFPLVLVTEWPYQTKELPSGVTIINVNHSEEALWKFIRFYRAQFQLPVVAITGTAGKTTTKEMIKHIVTPYKKVTATQFSTNSRTAHFPYLLSIEEDTEAAVFETAVGGPGDLLKAGKYFKPTIGIITNIGEHHLNYCKTLEGYIEAKAEMLDILDGGVLIINAGDLNTRKIDFSKFNGKMITIGTDDANEFVAKNIQYSINGMAFTVVHKGQQHPIYVPGFGEHQVLNALAAIAAVTEIGLTIPQAAKQLQSFRPLNKQLQLVEGQNGALLLDDTWSITTTSLEAGLNVLNALAKEKKRIAVIGTITDVGSWGTYIHKKAAELVKEKGVDLLITVGEHAKILADHALALGIQAPVYRFNNSVLAYELLKNEMNPNTIILIKGDMYSKTMFELATKLKKK
ncbi:UDP-N-acetylmuramoyl-tripeptide--D-alanyl-D-alanine ligase [Solibacillus sp.]|uniref:UDP-N-acetylmuramoyl-tripeptide--D-alanyl-D- alanine ligase n=1 Tax=Solibacillus sp. TaxID=1909654 RepID=UPI00331499F0